MLRNLLIDYGESKATARYFIPIWIPGIVPKTFIDYGLYIRVINIIAEDSFQNYNHNVCIGVADLPVSRLYFDLDCRKCKMNRMPCHAGVDHQVAALSLLVEELERMTGSTIQESQLFVAVKSVGGCGMHVTVDVLIDFVARSIIMKELGGTPFGTFICDDPSNVLLPGGRGYDQVLNTRSRTTMPLTLGAAMDGGSVVVTGEHLKDCDHISVRIQSMPGDSPEPIRWTDTGCVYVGDSPALMWARVNIWERIKAFNCSAGDVPVTHLIYTKSTIPIKWFTPLVRVISKNLVSHYQIKDSLPHQCTKLNQTKLTFTDTSPGTGSNANDHEIRDEDMDCVADMNLSESFVDMYNLWSQTSVREETARLHLPVGQSWLPYTRAESEWLAKQVTLSTRRVNQIFTNMRKLDQWYETEGCLISQTCVSLVQMIRSSSNSGTGGGGGGGGGGRRKRTRNNTYSGGGGGGGDERDDSCPEIVIPTLAELMNLALSRMSVTATVSFLARTTNLSIEDSCVMLMWMCRSVVSANPNIEFILTRLAVADKQLSNSLLHGYRGCDLFYHFVHSHLCMPALSMLNRLLAIDEEILLKDANIKKTVCGYLLNCSRGGDKTLLFDGEKMIFMNHRVLKELPLPRAQLAAPEGSYSYRCNYGIYNPFTRIMEANGPSLVEIVYRIFSNERAQLTPNVALHELAMNYIMKIPRFIEHLQCTTLYPTLVAPLWPVYETYPNTHEYYVRSSQVIETFAITSFQTLLEDFTVVIEKYRTAPALFPRQFFTTLERFTKLRKLVLTVVSMLYTLNTQFNISYEAPSMLISKLFGSDYWQCIGTQFRCRWNQKDNTVSKESSLTEFGPDFTEEGDGSGLLDDTPSEECMTDGASDVLMIRRFLNANKNHKEIIQRVGRAMEEAGPDDTHAEMLIEPVQDRPLGGSRLSKYTDSVTETLEVFTRINLAPLLAGGGEDFLNKIDTTYQDVNLYALLITSWFIRMGDCHRLYETPIFKYIDEHRRELYEELCLLAEVLVPHGRVECESSDALIPLFEEFDARTEISSPVLYNDVFNVDHIVGHYKPTSSHKERQELKRHMKHSVQEMDKKKIISALMELLRSSNYNEDLFLEISKLCGYCEYLGNSLRIGINLYGASGSGKTSLMTCMSKTFNTNMPSNLTSKQFKEALTGDNDPNARTIGTNFICHMNEENVVLVSRFKSYVDVGVLVTRDCHATEVIEFPIRAKVVFCTNDPVQVENAIDDGFHQRYYPIPLTYSFKDFEPGLDRLIRHRIENPTPSMYLGGQLLMNLHTSGRTVNLAPKLEYLSHHLLGVFFFNSLQHPIPKIQTCHVRDDYIKYFSRTNPMRLFTKHAHIEYSHIPMSDKRLHEILDSWWENNKTRIEYKFPTNSGFSKWLNKIDYFSKYRQNDQYFMRLFFNKTCTD